MLSRSYAGIGSMDQARKTRRDIAEAELRKLYLAHQLTIAQVAVRCGVAPTTISRRFADLGIHTRRRGPIARHPLALEPLEWTADLAYAVGLIATDGNLSRRPGRLTIVSNDVDLLEAARRRLGLEVPINPHKGGYGHRCHRIAWSDRRFYDWLVGIGLTPAKSLTLGPLAIPDEYFSNFCRGCIDGDGSIVVYTDRYHATKNARYAYDRLYVSLVSASRPFVDWVQTTAHRLVGVRGSVGNKRTPGRRVIRILRYAKQESIEMLRWIYYEPSILCLHRKRVVAERFLQPLGRAHARPGRPRAGWLYNRASDKL